MKKIEITKKNAMAAYAKAPVEFKPTLATLFGQDVIDTRPITEWAETWQDLLEVSGETLTIPNPVGDRQIALNCTEMMWIARDVISEGWEANPADSSQRKYEVVYEWNGSSFGFSRSHHWLTLTRTLVGARLQFESDAKARFFVKIMGEYIDQVLIKNYNKNEKNA